MGDLCNPLEVSKYHLVTVDMGFGHFPVVDPGISRLAGIGKHDAAIEIIEINRNLAPLDAGWSQINRTDASVHCRIVILAAGRNLDDLRLDILGNLPNLLDLVSAACQLVEGARDRN